MNNLVYINGKELKATWNAFLKAGAYAEFLGTGSMKEYVENDYRDQNGKEVLIDNPREDSRELTVSFVINGSTRPVLLSNYNSLIAELQSGELEIMIPDLNCTFLCYYKSSSKPKTFTADTIVIDVTLAEPNPKGRMYNDDPIVPTPDVNALIEQHNTSPTAHPDIREILNTCVGLPEFNDKTYELTFTTKAGSKIIIDLPIEQMGLEYNQTTKAIEFVNADGSISSIPVADFVKVYVGSIGSEIQIAVVGSEIRATLLNNTVSWDKLTLALQELIQDKADRSDIPSKLSELQNDSGFVTSQTLDSRLKPIEATQKKETVIDATTLDQDKYYPVTIGLYVAVEAKLRLYDTIGHDTGKPSWGTHPNGFSCIAQWSDIGSGWGSVNASRIIDEYQFMYCRDDVPPMGSIGQMGESSNAYIYVRGGAKYQFQYSNAAGNPVLHAEDFTANGNTLKAGISAVRKEESLNKVANDAVKRIRMNATMGAESANWPLSLNTPLVSMQQYYTLFTSYPGQCRWALRVTDAQNAFIEEAELEPVAVSGGIELQFTSKFSKKRYAIVLTLSGGTVTAVKTAYRYRDDQQKYIDVTKGIGYALSRVTFNVNTGYWELNGLTDITDEQMAAIYSRGNIANALSINSGTNANPLVCRSYMCRTTIPGSADPRVDASAFMRESNIEVLCFNTIYWNANEPGNLRCVFTGDAMFLMACNSIKSVIDICVDYYGDSGHQLLLSNVPLLETLKFQSLKRNINASGAPKLSTESALYWIQNEAAAAPVTWTFHADVYTRLMADADIQSALQAHPNIALASA